MSNPTIGCDVQECLFSALREVASHKQEEQRKEGPNQRAPLAVEFLLVLPFTTLASPKSFALNRIHRGSLLFSSLGLRFFHLERSKKKRS